MDEHKCDSSAPSSFMSDDLPEGGLAEAELEIARKRLNDERKDGFRKYAKTKMAPEGEGFE